MSLVHVRNRKDKSDEGKKWSCHRIMSINMLNKEALHLKARHPHKTDALFTLDLCATVNVTVKVEHCTKCREWVRTIDTMFNFDGDANADVKCEEACGSRAEVYFCNNNFFA